MASLVFSKSSVVTAATASRYCAMILVALILLSSFSETSTVVVRGSQLSQRACDEIYVVGEGETLHTISDKCEDPFIVERNPHVHDSDDVFPGLVLHITPSNPRK